MCRHVCRHVYRHVLSMYVGKCSSAQQYRGDGPNRMSCLCAGSFGRRVVRACVSCVSRTRVWRVWPGGWPARHGTSIKVEGRKEGRKAWLKGQRLKGQGLKGEWLEGQGVERQGLEGQGLEGQWLEAQGLEGQGLERQGLEAQGLGGQGLEGQGPHGPWLLARACVCVFHTCACFWLYMALSITPPATRCSLAAWHAPKHQLTS